jgi:hypothetical protein
MVGFLERGVGVDVAVGVARGGGRDEDDVLVEAGAQGGVGVQG